MVGCSVRYWNWYWYSYWYWYWRRVLGILAVHMILVPLSCCKIYAWYLVQKLPGKKLREQ